MKKKFMKTGVLAGALAFVMGMTTSCGNKNRAFEADSDSKKDAIVEVLNSNNEVSTSLVEVVDSGNLRIYYPNYSKIDLVCGSLPQKDNDSVIMVCAAAYTVKRLDHFEHSNIIGNHVSNGKLYHGAPSNTYRGAFCYYDGKPYFVHDDWSKELKEVADKGGCGFAQDMMIHDGNIVDYWRDDDSKNLFRALCLLGDRLAIIDSKTEMPFKKFVSALSDAGVSEAIYLDMGGWKHSWYRDNDGNAVDIYPNPNKYGTNWITFYK